MLRCRLVWIFRWQLGAPAVSLGEALACPRFFVGAKLCLSRQLLQLGARPCLRARGARSALAPLPRRVNPLSMHVRGPTPWRGSAISAPSAKAVAAFYAMHWGGTCGAK